MSRSLPRANVWCRITALTWQGRRAARSGRRTATCYLSAAFENESVQQQQDHGADDGHDPAGDVIPARKDATDPGTNKRAGDAEQNRDDATAGISSRHQQFRDRTDDKTDKQSPNDRMSAKVHKRVVLS
jgi:hypothetical protein